MTAWILSRLSRISIGVVIVGSLLYGFSLSRIPRMSVDEAFFAYPALKAALGGTLTYAVSKSAPFGSSIWAYHGPALPYLDELLFRVFGFNTMVSRLPDFMGGWMAALLIALFLNRKQFKYAGFAFAILWCGDFSVQMLNLGRMDGLALLSIVVTFLFLNEALSTGQFSHLFVCGMFFGLSILIHPLCILFGITTIALLWLFGSTKQALIAAAGASLSLPGLLLFWNFRVRDSAAQFVWHSRHLQRNNGTRALVRLFHSIDWLNWPWIIGLVVFTLVGAILAARNVCLRGCTPDPRDRSIFLAVAFSVTGLILVILSPLFSYYFIYFSIWPILSIVMIAETYWRRSRAFIFVLAFLWLLSAGGNALRLRRSVRYYSAFNRQFLYSILTHNVPSTSVILATPRLYSIPTMAGYKNFGLTTWFHESEDACPRCYLIMTESEFQAADLVTRSNLEQREVLYTGPAFPAAGSLGDPVVLLSPERLPSGAFRTDGLMPR